eukprot:6061557-Pleurochrysis_carterae.AAC.1
MRHATRCVVRSAAARRCSAARCRACVPSQTLIPTRVVVRHVEMKHKRRKSVVFGPGVRRSFRATREEVEDVSTAAAVVAKAADMKADSRTTEEAAALNRNLCIKALFLRNEMGTQHLTLLHT